MSFLEPEPKPYSNSNQDVDDVEPSKSTPLVEQEKNGSFDFDLSSLIRTSNNQNLLYKEIILIYPKLQPRKKWRSYLGKKNHQVNPTRKNRVSILTPT